MSITKVIFILLSDPVYLVSAVNSDGGAGWRRTGSSMLQEVELLDSVSCVLVDLIRPSAASFGGGHGRTRELKDSCVYYKISSRPDGYVSSSVFIHPPTLCSKLNSFLQQHSGQLWRSHLRAI